MTLPCFSVTARADGGRVSAENVACNAGDKVSMKLSLSNNPGIIALVIAVEYDPADITLVEAKDSGLLGSGTSLFTDDISAVPFILSWEDGLSKTNYSNNGTLATLTFSVNKNAAGKTIPVKLTCQEAYDTELNDVSFSVTDGLISVKGSANPTASSSATKTTSSATTTSSTSTSPTTSKTTASKTTTTKATESQIGKVKISRLAGSDRIETSIAISKESWTNTDTVVLANGYNFADALAGTPLASAVNAPILLTGGKKLEDSVRNEISRLKVKKAYLLGGPAAISADIESALKKEGISVVRLSGNDRYGTAIEIAKELAKKTDGKFTEIYFACASNFPDALSVSSIAAIQGNPILYAPQNGSLTNETASYAKSTGCKNATVLGGPAAISETGLNSIKSQGLKASRVYGNDRYATALEIYKKYNGLFGKGTVTVATGGNFPDALSGAVLAARRKAPVILVGGRISDDLKGYLKGYSLTNMYVFGGTNAVSDSLIQNLL